MVGCDADDKSPNGNCIKDGALKKIAAMKVEKLKVQIAGRVWYEDQSKDGEWYFASDVCQLIMTDCSEIGDEGLIALVSKCENLEVLKPPESISDDVLKTISDDDGSLTEIDLRRCTQVSPNSVAHIIRKCPNLRNILGWLEVSEVDGVQTLTGTPLVTDRVLDSFLRNTAFEGNSIAKTVKSVVLQGCRRITDEGLTVLATECESATKLVLSGCSIKLNGAVVAALKTRSLEHIDLSHCADIRDDQICELAESWGSSLTSIDVSGCRVVSSQLISALADHCPNLESFKGTTVLLKNPPVNDEASLLSDVEDGEKKRHRALEELTTKLAKICKGNKLHTLSLVGCTWLWELGNDWYPDPGGGLRHICFNGCEMTTKQISHLAKTGLRTVELAG